MAISNSKSTKIQSGWTLKVQFEETGTSTTNNTSSVWCKATLQSDSGYSFSYSAGGGNLKVYWHDDRTNSDTLVSSKTVKTVNSASSDSTSGTITVTHRADGELWGYAKAVWDKTHSSSWVPGDDDVSTSWTQLTKIPRKSKPTATPNAISIPDTAGTGTLKINTNRAVSTFTHTITIKIGDTTIAEDTGVGADITYALTDIQNAILAEIPNADTATLTVACRTFNGSTDLGTETTTVAVSVNDDAAPTFSNFTFADTNATTAAITGNDQVLISGKSSLTAYIAAADAAAPKYSAMMSQYTFTINAQTGTEPWSAQAITKALGAVTLPETTTENQAKDLVVAAIDSRGKSTSATKTLVVLPYRTPTINASAARLNGFENQTTLTVSGSVSPLLVSGTGKNSVNATSGLQYRYKAQSTTTWGNWTNIASTYDASTGAVSANNIIINLDNQTAYDLEFRITDALETGTAAITVSQGQPAVYVGDDSRMSVGGMPTISKASGKRGQLEVLGNAYANGERLIQSHVGQIIMSTTLDTAAKVSEIYGGTWTQIKDTFLLAAGDTYSAGSTGGSDTHDHKLSNRGFAKIVLKKANKIVYRETEHLDEQWYSNYYESASGGGDGSTYEKYGADLGGRTDNATTLPPYKVVYIWQRTA